MAFIKGKPKVSAVKQDTDQIANPEELVAYALRHSISVNPIDLPSLVEKLGLKLRFEPMEGDESGSLKKDKKTGFWVITINSLHHPNRQRFTIAHELGHYIKHSIQQDEFNDTVFFRNGETNIFETEANCFAAELLMPEQDFRDFVDKTSSKVDEIAEYFQVSTMAVRVRAKQLGFKGHNL